jgi:dTDP-4-amino-4,6-dideoxygalactose transaminase
MIPHNKLFFGEQEICAVNRVLRSGYWAGGKVVGRLELELARCFAVKHAVCVGSGLAALRISLLALGIRTGARVLVPAYACVALANSVLAAGAEPVPVDCETENWNVDPEDFANLGQQRKAKAAIVVNTFGSPVGNEVFRRAGFPVIEDISHGFASADKPWHPVLRGEIGICSFYATKLIGGGEGGAVLTNNGRAAEFVRAWRDYADQAPCGRRLNDKMTDIEAALVLCKIKVLPKLIRERRRLACYYDALLNRIDRSRTEIASPVPDNGRLWYRYVIQFRRKRASGGLDFLKNKGIDACRPITKWTWRGQRDCPQADRAFRENVSLPLFVGLRSNQQRHVVGMLDLYCGR